MYSKLLTHFKRITNKGLAAGGHNAVQGFGAKFPASEQFLQFEEIEPFG